MREERGRGLLVDSMVVVMVKLMRRDQKVNNLTNGQMPAKSSIREGGLV